MGCTSSEARVGSTNKLIVNRKPSVWFIGGGPGCQKGKICDYLIRDYKFKYLSSYDIVQFEQERGGPDAEQIQKLFKQKSIMPSHLIVRLVKKAIASCGIRRFIIDGFPNSVQDVLEFDKQLTEKQIDFYGYLHIQISERKMIESGIEAHSANKTKTKEEIQSNVKQIVKTYRAQSQKIKNQYKKKQKYHQINGQNGADKAYQAVKQYLSQICIAPPKAVKVFFTHFDDRTHQNVFCDDLVRKYGFYYYNPKGLIHQALSKHNTPEGEIIRKLQQQSKQVPSSIVLSLIRKKLEKHDYDGHFLINGFPRKIDDSLEWDKVFGWETQILGYLTFQIPDQKFKKIFSDNIIKFKPNIKSEQINKQFDKYQSNQIKICEWYQKKGKLLKIDSENEKKALADIHQFFKQQNFHSRDKLSNKKIAFLSTLNGMGAQVIKQVSRKGATVVDMQILIKDKIKEKGLYSQLIQSFIKIGKPISGIIATRILLEKLLSDNTSKSILIQGFPNSEEQLQSWEQQVGQSIELSIIILTNYQQKFIQQSIKNKIKQNKIFANQKDVIELIKEQSKKLQQRVKGSDWRSLIFDPVDSSSKLEQVLNKANFY